MSAPVSTLAPCKLALLFGGRSAEHEVSLESARNIYEALDKERFEVTLIGIAKDGQWYHDAEGKVLQGYSTFTELAPVSLQPGSEKPLLVHGKTPQSLGVDVVFPVLHGTYGEDGAVQGLLKMLGLPFVGSGVLGSSASMDKELMKRLLVQADIPTAPWVSCHASQKENFSSDYVASQIGEYPWFVKPANLGSSVGIHKINSEADFKAAITDAFLYDQKILIEKGLDCREIECAVLGNRGNSQISVPGEIVVNAEFYSYEAKYVDADGATLCIPAELNDTVRQRIQTLALKTFEVLEAEGLARVDCFLTHNNEVYMNEINTLPGFTRISMYPKLWEATGINYRDLLNQLVDLALIRSAEEQKLKTSF